MAIDGEGTAGHKIHGPLGLVRLHHREVQDHGFAVPQGLNGPGHLIEAAGLHQSDLGRTGRKPGHADHIGASKRIFRVEARRQGQSIGATSGSGLIELATVVIKLIVIVAIEVVISRDNGTQARKQRHRENLKGSLST